MVFSLRKALMLLALSVAVSGPAMAKDSTTTKKAKSKSSLSSKKSTTKKSASKSSEGKSQYKNTTVNINKANAAALSAYLVGVGPVKAKAIVAYRSKNGKFSNIKDLMKVEGVGEGVYGGLKKNISTSRGESSAPKDYKMGDVKSKKKSTSAKKKSTSSKTKAKAKATSSKAKTTTAKTSKAKSKSSASKTKAKSKTSKAKTKKKTATKAKKKKVVKKKTK